MNPSTALGALLADELARCGLREVVVAPGSRSTPLAMAFWELDRAGRVRLHVRIDERTGAFLALGLAKVTGRPVPVLTTSGTATAHLHAAALEAGDLARVGVGRGHQPLCRVKRLNRLVEPSLVFSW